MKGMNVSPTRRRHLPLEMQSKVVRQEVTGSQSGAAVQSTFANVQTNHKIGEALKELKKQVIGTNGNQEDHHEFKWLRETLSW